MPRVGQRGSSGITFNIGKTSIYSFFFFLAQQPPVDQGNLNLEASRSHSDAPHSVELLWMSDQLVAEISV